MRHKAKAVIRAAGLRDELSFTSFRHGGLPEAANSDLTGRDQGAGPAQVGERVCTIRRAADMKQVAGARKRRSTRTKDALLSE